MSIPVTMEIMEPIAEYPHRIMARTVALFRTERLNLKGKRHLRSRWMDTVRIKCMLATVLIVTVLAKMKHRTFPITHLKYCI